MFTEALPKKAVPLLLTVSHYTLRPRTVRNLRKVPPNSATQSEVLRRKGQCDVIDFRLGEGSVRLCARQANAG